MNANEHKLKATTWNDAYIFHEVLMIVTTFC